MLHSQKYDIVLVGTGFASAFFLKKALESVDVRHVLVLERGKRFSYSWQVENERHNDAARPFPHQEAGLAKKWWNYNIGFGGGSNYWWTNAMRIHPDDFQLKSRYGVGMDWPLSYEDLEPYYCDAEDEMLVSGDNSSAVMFPRSRPFPQPRHRYSGVGSALKAAYPDHTFAMPTTRARVANDRRGTGSQGWTATRRFLLTRTCCALYVRMQSNITADLRPSLRPALSQRPTLPMIRPPGKLCSRGCPRRGHPNI